ncbi:sporulation protein SsgA [Altererythrobacter indicus]|uniref:Sporulation protein SsgA n=2 Tax=Altericroceibacterium indicum TaxID=374177 RepID=A0A845A668_9SPHN|nr:sporulation protein SsgA [Altericroceibacterium indicum]
MAGIALSGCNYNAAPRNIAPAPSANGPAADYPMLIGPPYQVNGVTYRPSDSLNYDRVGYAQLDSAGGASITAAHHTMPVPSYVEVTSLDTGRTILVRIERRGPMDSNALIALSPGALDQLGAKPGVPVRVRRVNPPEEERSLLRSGQQASPRMDTPQSLLDVLKQRLPAEGSASLLAQEDQTEEEVTSGEKPIRQTSPSPRPAGVAQAVPAPKAPTQPQSPPPPPPPLPTVNPAKTSSGDGFADAFPARQTSVPVVQPTPQTSPQPKPSAAAKAGRYMVQAATFSTMERAKNAARKLGAHVTPSGKYFLMQTGPFVSRAEAQASLAKVKAAGYSDARIFTRSK